MFVFNGDKFFIIYWSELPVLIISLYNKITLHIVHVRSDNKCEGFLCECIVGLVVSECVPLEKTKHFLSYSRTLSPRLLTESKLL